MQHYNVILVRARAPAPPSPSRRPSRRGLIDLSVGVSAIVGLGMSAVRRNDLGLPKAFEWRRLSAGVVLIANRPAAWSGRELGE